MNKEINPFFQAMIKRVSQKAPITMQVLDIPKAEYRDLTPLEQHIASLKPSKETRDLCEQRVVFPGTEYMAV